MAHGHPDWGADAPLATVYSLQDLAELAARLSSIVTFDRRGNVIFLDSFDHGLMGWVASPFGTGAAVEQSAEFCRTGPFCAKLTGGSTSPHAALLLRSFPYPVLGKLGLEFSFDLNSVVDYFYAGLIMETGATRYRARLRFQPDAGDVDYEDSEGSWVNLLTGASFSTTKVRHTTVKIVADFLNAKYCRVIFNNQTFDLSAEDLWSLASAAAAYVGISFLVNSDAGENGICWLDDVIVTQNEP